MVNRTFILIAALVLPCYAGDEDAPGQHRYLVPARKPFNYMI